MAASLEDRIVLSERLHRRVRSLATRELSLRSVEPGAPPLSAIAGEFVSLACDIAAFQTGRHFEQLEQVVRHAVPADCFKFGDVFQFPRAMAKHAFRTSGTTAVDTGAHLMRDAQTYEQLSLAWGNLALAFGDAPSPVVVALAPWTGRNTSSSLGYMMQRMMERFDGKSLSEGRLESAFCLEDPLRWLVSARGIDVSGLRRVVEVAHAAATRVVVLATSFALVELLDALEGATLALPNGSVVMPTGGFKGRTRTIGPEVMERELRRTFGDIDLVAEYGMTELTSQLYEGTRRGGLLVGTPGLFLPPPWLAVVPCCPQTLEPVAEGESGVACFIDLGNVDSAVALLTHDLVRREDNGIRLLGRQQAAPVRGCSLAIEALLNPASVADATLRTSGARTDANAFPTLDEVDSNIEHARARVMQLIAGANECKRVLLQDESQLKRLATTSFMAVAGIRLALELALETEPSSREIEALVSRARAACPTAHEACTVWVVLSSTVFTSAHRAVALALSISPRVKLKPSRRQPEFALALAQACGGLFDVVEHIAPVAGDLVLVFGSDGTIETLRKTLPAGVSLQGFGHGMGVAVVGAQANLQASARGLAIDMVLFEQQGCLSPRLLLLDAACDGHAFKQRLSSELETLAKLIPLGEQSPGHAARATWELRVAQSFATISLHSSGWFAEYAERWCLEHPVPLSSAPRTLSIVRTSRPLALLAPIAKLVTCVGFAGDDALTQVLARQLPNARRVALGTMQRPKFDGPVDLRFLT